MIGPQLNDCDPNWSGTALDIFFQEANHSPRIFWLFALCALLYGSMVHQRQLGRNVHEHGCKSPSHDGILGISSFLGDDHIGENWLFTGQKDPTSVCALTFCRSPIFSAPFYYALGLCL